MKTLYEQDIPLKEIEEKLGCSRQKIFEAIKKFNIPEREHRASYRQALGYIPIETLVHLIELIEDRVCYKLQACHCDYLVKYIDSNQCWLIEEKQSWTKLNYSVAAVQLLIGEKIIHQNTDLIVSRKIILAHKHNFKAKYNRSFHIIEDFKDYLDIEVIILEPFSDETP